MKVRFDDTPPAWDALSDEARGGVVRYLRHVRTAEFLGHELDGTAHPVAALPHLSGRAIREAYAVDVRGLSNDEWDRLFYLG